MDTRIRQERFTEALNESRRANNELLVGRSGPLKDCYSHREDASLFGGFGAENVGVRGLCHVRRFIALYRLSARDWD